MEYLPVLGY